MMMTMMMMVLTMMMVLMGPQPYIEPYKEDESS